MSTRGRLLLADDDPEFVEANRVVLQGGGYEIEVAREPAECLAKARAGKPDMIILDLLWGGVSDGVPLVYSLQASEETEDIPILIVTGVFDRLPCFQEPADFWELADGVFRKPMAPEQLLCWVNRKLGQHRRLVEGSVRARR